MTFTKPIALRRGEAIRKARTDRRLSIFELATRVGIDPGHLSRAERGLAGIGDDYLVGIARALGKPPTHFIETPCPSADSATDAEPSPTPATPAARRSPAPSAGGPAESAHEGSPGNE